MLVKYTKSTSFLTGSGSLAAMAVFEDKFRPDMEVCKPCSFLLSDIFPVVCQTFTG